MTHNSKPTRADIIWIGEVREFRKRFKFYRAFADYDEAIQWLHHGNRGIPRGWTGMRVEKFARAKDQSR